MQNLFKYYYERFGEQFLDTFAECDQERLIEIRAEYEIEVPGGNSKDEWFGEPDSFCETLNEEQSESLMFYFATQVFVPNQQP